MGNVCCRKSSLGEKRNVTRRIHDERGASLTEYAMMLALIAVVVFSAVSFFGSSTGGGFAKSSSCISRAYEGTSTGPC